LSPVVGRISDRVDPRILVTISFGVFSLVLFMRSHFSTDATIGTLMLPTIIQGAGMAAFFIPLVSISLSGLPPDRIPAASGLFNFARITAGAFGTSITTTVWDRRATLHHAQLVERMTTGDPVTSQALGTLHTGGVGSDQGVHAVGQRHLLCFRDRLSRAHLPHLARAPGARQKRRRRRVRRALKFGPAVLRRRLAQP
jgi:DHA2 family multidrug resistance protein